MKGLALGGAIAFVPESRVRTRGRIDIGGAVLMTVWLVALLVALTKGQTWGWVSASTLGLFAVSGQKVRPTAEQIAAQVSQNDGDAIDPGRWPPHENIVNPTVVPRFPLAARD
jgi:hypothetical protein